MAGLSLAFVAAMHGVAAVAFLVVGRTLARRPVAAEDRLAARAFVVWWWGLGLYMVLRGALTAYAAAQEPQVTVFLVARALAIPLLVVAIWGLVFHILYLFTGHRALAVPLAVFYAMMGAAFFVAGYVPLPGAVQVDEWYVGLEGEGESLLYRIVYGVLGLSIVGSAVAYLTILPKVEDRLQRLRVVLVAGSILLWVASGLVAFGSASDAARFVVLTFVGLGTAATVIVAYHPPRVIEAWAHGRLAEHRDENRRRMRRRAGELI